ncbi:MAG: TIGR02281 family clan AA aspartic protease [Flavobacteriaceae bacterium]
MTSLKKFLKGKNFVRIPLHFTTTNHFDIKAEINGVPGRFILDTGASNTCIDLDRITYFNLAYETSETKAAGAGATDMDTLISTQNHIKIGKWQRKRLKIVLLDLVHVNTALSSHDTDPVDGIIGADILKKGRAIIDYRHKALYLWDKK